MKGMQIIKAVLADHKIYPGDFFSRSRESHLVAARRDAAKRLSAEKFPVNQIARFLKRNHTTICFYLNENMQQRKKRVAEDNYPLRWLDPDAGRIVREIAIAENTTPLVIAAQWIGERARHEAEQKVRAA